MSQQPEQNKTVEFKRWNAEIKTLIAGHRGIFSREVHWTECVPALAGYVGQQTASLQKQRDEAITNLENCESLKTFIEQKEQIKSLQKQVEELREENERLKANQGKQNVAILNHLVDKGKFESRIAQLEEALKTIRFACYSRDTDDEIIDRIKDELTESGFPYDPED